MTLLSPDEGRGDDVAPAQSSYFFTSFINDESCVMCSCHMILLGSSMHQTLCLVCSVAKQFEAPTLIVSKRDEMDSKQSKTGSVLLRH